VNDDDRDRLPDEISVDWAIDILKQDHNQPFYLAVGLTKPHTPLYVPQKYFDLFPIENVELPPYLENDLDDCAPTLRNRWEWGFQKFKALIDSGGNEAWREFVQAYLATVTFVDDQIGKLLDTLDATSQSDNTIVILTSDNGYHVGEKDCIQKWHLWDESTRIPMLIHVPDCPKNGQDCDHPVSHIDLYPTLIDFCNLPQHPHRDPDKTLDGHSLRPFLEDPNTNNWTGPSAALMAIRDGRETPHFSVCSHQYRYTLCANGEEEFYDHYADPHEWTNLAENEEYTTIKNKLREELMAMLRESKIPKGYQ
jgi:arylsulfatase A-like enzyme